MNTTSKVPRVDLEEVARRNNTDIINVGSAIARAQDSLTPLTKKYEVIENGSSRTYTVTRKGVGYIKAHAGTFWQFSFAVDDVWERYSVLVKGRISSDFHPEFKDASRVMLRIDSGCESGQKFGDFTCECRDQLVLAMQQIERNGEGIIINIPDQDGRGMGNPFKLATLFLQEELKLDTVEAASILANGGMIDKRTYGGIIAILSFLGVGKEKEILLMTNNDHKISIFGENGYRTTKRIPTVIPPTIHTQLHLAAKQRHLGHRDLVAEKGTP